MLYFNCDVNIWDEGVPLNGALRMFDGERPIRDFMAYPPGRYFIFFCCHENRRCIRKRSQNRNVVPLGMLCFTDLDYGEKSRVNKNSSDSSDPISAHAHVLLLPLLLNLPLAAGSCNRSSVEITQSEEGCLIRFFTRQL